MRGIGPGRLRAPWCPRAAGGDNPDARGAAVTEMPFDPLRPVTDLDAVTTFHHELYLSYQAAGFDEPAALELLKTWVQCAFASGMGRQL